MASDSRAWAISLNNVSWLVTFGPGEIYWERFGHNAIWLREPAVGLDHTFNFGFFDFEQEDFFLRFLRGRMLYFSVAQPAQREFDFYRQYNRTIRLQKINLSDEQYVRLRDFLLNEIKPDMLREATKNARIAANEFAENAGVKVGGIRDARQGSFYVRDAGSDYGDTSKIEKDVRVVTTITFYLTE